MSRSDTDQRIHVRKTSNPNISEELSRDAGVWPPCRLLMHQEQLLQEQQTLRGLSTMHCMWTSADDMMTFNSTDELCSALWQCQSTDRKSCTEALPGKEPSTAVLTAHVGLHRCKGQLQFTPRNLHCDWCPQLEPAVPLPRASAHHHQHPHCPLQQHRNLIQTAILQMGFWSVHPEQ